MTKIIVFNNLPIAVTYKNVKYIYLRICSSDGSLKMSIPNYTSVTYITNFLKKNWIWVENKLAQFKNRTQFNFLQFKNNERHLFLGQNYTLRIIETSNLSKVYSNLFDIVIEINPLSKTKPEELMQEFYINNLKKLVFNILPKWENKIKVKSEKVIFKKMKSRWGYCYPNRRYIGLNIELAKYSLAVIEYVLVHELVHILEPSHNARFWHFMDQFYPNWAEIKKELNKKIIC